MRSRADVSGLHDHHGRFAATRENSGSRVTSGERYARPFTTRGDSEGKSWFYEKNGRRVLHLDDGRYWRAPRPRPRPNRRKRRRESKSIIKAALQVTDAPKSPTTDAEVVILVLQRSLRNAISREKNKEVAMAEVNEKLEMAEAKLQRARNKRKETKVTHETELEAAARKLKKAQRKLEEVQQQHTAELSASKEKLVKAQQRNRKLQETLDDTQPQPNKEPKQPEPKQPQAVPEADSEFNYACYMLNSVALTWQEMCYYSAIIVWKGSSWYHWFIRNVAIIVMILVAKLVYDNFQSVIEFIMMQVLYLLPHVWCSRHSAGTESFS